MSEPVSILKNLEPLKAAPSAAGLQLDPRTYDRALSCVHCGLCLPVCPTYLQTAHEADSPRGRIQLMRGLSEGAIAPTPSVREHLDLCLDCRACETACPSNVVYHELIEETRSRLLSKRPQVATAKEGAAANALRRWVIFHILTHPRRLKLAMLPIRTAQKIGLYGLMQRLRIPELLPPALQKMLQMMPSSGPLWPRPLPDHNGAGGMNAVMDALRNTASQSQKTEREEKPPHLTIGLLTGCVGQIVCNDINRQSVNLLNACGLNVYAPSAQQCCGAIHHHSGDTKTARALARRNIDLFLPRGIKGADFITTNIAGCGAMLKEYDLLLRDDPDYSLRAKDFSKRVRDITELLIQQKLPSMKYAVNLTATYHDACHLAHAQRVTSAPRQLLAAIPGLKLVPLPEHDLCCGAAGVYNLSHPEMASQIAERKLKNIQSTGAEVVITGNAGCSMQIASQATAAGHPLRVAHPVELLHQAIFGSTGHKK